MSLIICPDCGDKVSNKATSCPGCGHPVNQVSTKTRRAGAKYEAAGFLLITSSIFVGVGLGIQAAITTGTIGFIIFLIGRFR